MSDYRDVPPGPTRIRVVEEADAEVLAELVTASAEHLRPWEPVRPPAYRTPDGQREAIRSVLREWQSERAVPFVVEDGEGCVIGRVTLSGVVRGALQSCAMGYWVAAQHSGRGHATRAGALAVRHAFEDLGLHRVQAETMPHNEASQRVLLRLGFRQYGRAEQYLRIGGVWRDHLMFQLLDPGA